MLDLSAVIPVNAECKAKPYPYNEDQRDWLRDLETTNAPQASGYLFAAGINNKFGFCCLGRAALVLGAPIVSEHDHFRFGTITDSSSTSLPKDLRTRLRLLSENGSFRHEVTVNGQTYCGLTAMNDGLPPLTFKEIAAYIRYDPWNVFLAPDEDGTESHYDALPALQRMEPFERFVKPEPEAKEIVVTLTPPTPVLTLPAAGTFSNV